MAAAPEEPQTGGFAPLGLSPAVLRAVEEIGYEAPSPIQEQTIPHILAGHDVVGQAQTGTGKTGAFALPLLSRLDMAAAARTQVQVLVLVPTRELAIQVSEAFARYAVHIPGFHVLPIYGGTGYEPQLKHLRKGSQVVVGTPGRLADHLRRGTLKLDALKAVVLDEADEMLRMGFIDEVEWILDRTPAGRQIALFSATMPPPIRRIALNTLQNPVEVTIKERTATASAIRQRYWLVSGMHKLDALTRLLEAEDFDAMIIFVRMKTAAAELARKLQARGLTCEALSGDVAQREREAIVDRVRSGETDILVATDVAARGLDVPRISHVVNYDIPLDTESYIHRIGRTGRAGRTGEAILFVAPRERRLLAAIERATRQKIALMQMPSMEVIQDLRITRFRQRIMDVIAQDEALETYRAIVEALERDQGIDMANIAAACARLAQGDGPALEATTPRDAESKSPTQHPSTQPAPSTESTPSTQSAAPTEPAPFRPMMERIIDEVELEQAAARKRVYRIALGHRDRLKPGMLVGAIAGELGIPGKSIGNIQIELDHSLVELPGNLSEEQEEILHEVRLGSRTLRATRAPEGTEVRPFTPPERGGFDRNRGGYGGERGGYGAHRPSYGGSRGGGDSRFGGDRDSRPDNRPFNRYRRDDEPRGAQDGYRRPFSYSDREGFRGPSRPGGYGGGKRGFGSPSGPSRYDDRPRRDDYNDRRQREYPDRDDRPRSKPDFGGQGPKPGPRFSPPWDTPRGFKPGKPKRK